MSRAIQGAAKNIRLTGDSRRAIEASRYIGVKPAKREIGAVGPATAFASWLAEVSGHRSAKNTPRKSMCAGLLSLVGTLLKAIAARALFYLSLVYL